MLFKIAGRSDVNFTDDKGREIRGVSLWVLYNDDRVDGQKAEKFFCKEGIIKESIRPGNMINITFDMRGKVESVSKAADMVANGASTLKINKQ